MVIPAFCSLADGAVRLSRLAKVKVARTDTQGLADAIDDED